MIVAPPAPPATGEFVGNAAARALSTSSAFSGSQVTLRARRRVDLSNHPSLSFNNIDQMNPALAAIDWNPLIHNTRNFNPRKKFFIGIVWI